MKTQLRQWRDQWYPGAAPAENMQMPGMSSMNMEMSHMQAMSGHALDMMFIDMMIPHHEGGWPWVRMLWRKRNTGDQRTRAKDDREAEEKDRSDAAVEEGVGEVTTSHWSG